MENNKIYYLPSDYTMDIRASVNDDNTFIEEVINHPETEVFTLERFVHAFNTDYISDQGLIVIDTRMKFGKHNPNFQEDYNIAAHG